MKKILMILSTSMLLGGVASAQKINFEEYDLNNGLHVILHQDLSAPVVVTSVMYHVGSKDERPDRTGFAHFFEHLLFEGTKNIKRGEWMKIVTANGGTNNANTNDDRTYYYEVFPSNNLELGLWMESERMLHPIINQIGVKTQNEVVKEEKRSNYDNRSYGGVIKSVKENLFKNHPYRWTTIGDMKHLDAAKLDEFIDFNKKFYIPNNAVLVVAGDFDTTQTKIWIEKYFGIVPKGIDVKRIFFAEKPINQTIKATYKDPNIKIPMLVVAYRTPSMKTREAKVLDFISSYLSNGKSSKLYKKIVDDEKKALQVGAFNFSQEDYSMYILYGLPMGENSLETLLIDIDTEILKLQTELISENDFQKLQNKFETELVDENSNLEGIAENLASYYLLHQDVNLINNIGNIYRSITREEIKDVAQKYLNPQQRLILDYIPDKE